MRKSLLNFLASMALSLGLLSTVAAQEVIKIGQIEAQTGPSSSLGFMATQGVKLAVHQINQAGGVEVGGRKYLIDLDSPDTQGSPQQALIQLKKMVEQDNRKYIFGPTLSNVFNGVREYARGYDGKLLMFTPATAAHPELGKPGYGFLLRPVVFDTAPEVSAPTWSKCFAARARRRSPS